MSQNDTVKTEENYKDSDAQKTQKNENQKHQCKMARHVLR